MRNVSDAPLAINVSLSVDGVQAGRARALALAPGLVQWVEMPLQGVKAIGSTQTIACVVTSENKVVAGKTLDCMLVPCRYVGPWACPSDDTTKQGFSAAHPPEQEIDFSKSYDCVDGKAGLQRSVAGFNGNFDFLPKFKTTQFVIGYAVTFIHSDREVAAKLSFGHDDGIKAWVNGDRVVSREKGKPGGAAPGQETAMATLKKGWNTILIWISQDVAGWGFYFSVTDADGKPLKGICLADSPKP